MAYFLKKNTYIEAATTQLGGIKVKNLQKKICVQMIGKQEKWDYNCITYYRRSHSRVTQDRKKCVRVDDYNRPRV